MTFRDEMHRAVTTIVVDCGGHVAFDNNTTSVRPDRRRTAPDSILDSPQLVDWDDDEDEDNYDDEDGDFDLDEDEDDESDFSDDDEDFFVDDDDDEDEDFEFNEDDVGARSN